MDDAEKKLVNSVSDDITVEEVALKTAKTPKAKKSGKQGFFSQVKAEFKKIIWPSRQSLAMQIVAVIVATVVLGALIVLIDNVVRLGINMLIK